MGEPRHARGAEQLLGARGVKGLWNLRSEEAPESHVKDTGASLFESSFCRSSSGASPLRARYATQMLSMRNSMPETTA